MQKSKGESSVFGDLLTFAFFDLIYLLVVEFQYR